MEMYELTEKVVEYCRKNNIKKLYICGNGGAGKTTFSKMVAEKAREYGNANIISLDDFMAETELRKNAVIKWVENGEEKEYRYTSSIPETYFFKNVYELLYNIDNGLDCYYFPRRYKEKNNMRKLFADNVLTVIEGIGTVFLEKAENSLSVYLKCSKEEEIKRRIERTAEKQWHSIELYDENRSSQFRVFVEPLAEQFDVVVESGENYDLTILKGDRF